MLEPADPPQRVILVHVSVPFARTTAVAAGHDIEVPVAVDVGHLETGHAVRCERADTVRVPRVIDTRRLLHPGQSSRGPADDVESTILIEVGILEIESGRPGPVDPDGVFSKIQAPVSRVLEEQEAVLTT